MSSKHGEFLIRRLQSGGIITNYYCTSRCGHCLYGCGPGWPREYIDRETLLGVLERIRALGCPSVHIGGGEPFLNPEGLATVVETTLERGVGVDYVETNSSWFRDPDSALGLLRSLKGTGLGTLLVSMSPFHNEHIPFFKVKGVIEACRAAGMKVFPWIPEFYPEIDALDDRMTHSMSEYERCYGAGYLGRIPSRYWIHFGGRALGTFSRVLEIMPPGDAISSTPGGCRELLDTSHFHFDLFGNYIPGLCSGLGIDCKDLGHTLSPEKYPFLSVLFERGPGGLLELASAEYGFEPSGGYLSKCHLCFEIRRFLVLERGVGTRDLQPAEFYGQV